MTDKEAAILNKLSACSNWLRRAQDKYRPYLENLPAAGNNALAQASLAAGEAIRILIKEENVLDASK
jgi:hypothetical protein